MRRRTHTDNKINFDALFTIGNNAVKNDFTAEADTDTQKPQKRLVEPHRAVTTHSEAQGTINYAYNIKLLEQTETEIIKGLESGRDAKELLLIAVKGLDLATGTTALYDHARNIYTTVYTDALNDTATARLDLEQAQQRLARLEQAEPKTAEDKARITRAIAEHKKAIERYKDILRT